MVGLSFIDNPNNFSDINHIDGVRSNNVVTNLEWCSRSYNVNYSVDVFHKHSRNTHVTICKNGVPNIFGSMRKAEMYLGLPSHTLKLKPRNEWFTIDDYLVRVG